MVPLSGQDPPNAVKGEGSTIGFGLIKLLMSQDGVSDSVLCITTLSTMINLFQGNQSVLFSDRKGDLSKTRVTEMPPTATRSKLEKRKQIAFFLFYHNITTTSNASQTKTSCCLLQPLIYYVKSFKYTFLLSPWYLQRSFTSLCFLPVCINSKVQYFAVTWPTSPPTYQLESILMSHP